MSSKRLFPTFACAYVRPSPLPASRLATRTQSTVAASPQYAELSRRCSSVSASWMQRGGRPLVRPREAARSFGISASLRKEAGGDQGKQAKPEDVEFKQYKFEDISSALPSSSSASPSATPVLIDVREPVELSGTGIIPTALSLPIGTQPDALFLDDGEFLTRFGFPKPTTSPTSAPAGEEGEAAEDRGGAVQEGSNDMVFYCKAGVRAKAAAQLAVQAGYDPRRIGVYDGSWLDWEKRGGRVEKWEPDE